MNGTVEYRIGGCECGYGDNFRFTKRLDQCVLEIALCLKGGPEMHPARTRI